MSAENNHEEDPFASLSFAENQGSILKKEVINDNIYCFICCLLALIFSIFYVNFYSEVEINKSENMVYIQSLIPLKKRHELCNLNDLSYVKPKKIRHYKGFLHWTTIAAYDKTGFELFDTEPYYQTLFFKSSAEQKCSQINNTINNNSSGLKIKLANDFEISLAIVLILVCISSFRAYVSDKKQKHNIKRFDSIDFSP